MHRPLGEHYIIELYGCNSNVLDNLEEISSTLLESARIAGATIIDHSFHRFSPQGVSGVVVIAESHLSIHTWPEYGYAALDLFTCNFDMDTDSVFKLLKHSFQPEDIDVRRLQRGILNSTVRSISQPGIAHRISVG